MGAAHGREGSLVLLEVVASGEVGNVVLWWRHLVHLLLPVHAACRRWILFKHPQGLFNDPESPPPAQA